MAVCSRKNVRKNLQLILITIAIVVGFLVGLFVQKTRPSPDVIMWIGLPGDIFMRLFGMCILPLIIFSVISGVSAVDPQSNGKAGMIVLAFTVLHNVLGALIGVLVAMAIKPGTYMAAVEGKRSTQGVMKTQDIFADLIRNLFPENIVRAAIQKERTDYRPATYYLMGSNLSTHNYTTVMERHIVHPNSTNLLGILFFCIVFGIAIGRLGDKATGLRDVIATASDVIMLMLTWFMWYCPVGVASLIAAALAAQHELSSTFVRIGMLVCSLIIGTLIQIFLFYTLSYAIIVKKNPLKPLVYCSRVAPMAFATDNSTVIMPEYFRVCDQAGYSPDVGAMTIPLFSVICSPGSSLYISTASLFLAQTYLGNLNPAQLVLIVILTGVSSLAIPAAPSAAIVVVVMVINTFNVPAHLAGILFAVEWFVGRVRTTSNAICKVYGMAIVDTFCQIEEETVEEDLSDEEGKIGLKDNDLDLVVVK